MVGPSNISTVFMENKKAFCLLDSGSQVSFMTEDFYKSLNPKPSLLSIDDFQLTVRGPDGNQIPYIGYVKVLVSVPMQSQKIDLIIPMLVIPSAKFSSSVPVLIGTNIITRCQERLSDPSSVSKEWEAAFIALHTDSAVGTVTSTNTFSISLQPFEVKTVSGFVRKKQNVDSAVTESCENVFSCNIGVCPRVVTLSKPGKNGRVPVRIFNMSAKVVHIPAKAVLCELHEVKVLRSVDPFQANGDSAHVSNQTTSSKFDLQDIGVSQENSCLTSKQKVEASRVFEKWQGVFSKGPLDLGYTDVVRHKINLTDSTPFKEPYRPVPPALIQEVREHLNEMLESGVIRESQSPFSSNVVIVRKKDGSIRFCIDFRKLNSRTITDAYAIPRIQDTLHLLSGSNYVFQIRFKIRLLASRS